MRWNVMGASFGLGCLAVGTASAQPIQPRVATVPALTCLVAAQPETHPVSSEPGPSWSSEASDWMRATVLDRLTLPLSNSQRQDFWPLGWQAALDSAIQ
jgi:hypothetical protein